MTIPDAPPPTARAVRVLPAVAVLCSLLVLGGVASFAVRGAPLQEYFGAWVPQNAPVGLVGVTVFGLALRRQPANRAAWIFFLSGVAGSVHVAMMGSAHMAAARHPEVWARMLDGTIAVQDVPGPVMVPLWVAASIWLVAAGLPVLGLLYFPDGRLPSRRWRPVAWLGSAGLVLGVASWSWGYRPSSPHLLAFNFLPVDDGVSRALFLLATPMLAGCGLATIASLAVRMRTADLEERRRVRPVVVAGSLFVAAMVLLYPWRGLWAAVSVAAVIVFLTTVAASVARYRLFDVEVAVSRAVAAAVLGALITLAYVGLVAGIGGLLGASASLGVSAAATAIVAVGFEPLRRRVMAAARRLVLGARATPYETLAQLSDRLALADSTSEVLDLVAELLVQGTGAAAAEVRTRRDDGGTRLDATAGTRPASPAVRTASVVHSGDTLGEIRLLATREDRLSSGDERLLRQVAAAVGPVIRNARLTGALRDHIEELRASRQRIVTAHDDARRAVERDIHDGAQQQLLALRLRLGVAAAIARDEGSSATLAVIDEVAGQADAAIRQLRELARGMYPPLLAEAGLDAALRAHAREVPLHVTVRAHGVGRYGPAVESTAYFCCLEAMHNASRHAEATAISIELADVDGALAFDVTDNGVGFDTRAVSAGAGLTNMADRIQGLGGTFEIESARPGGTRVRGCIPVRDDDPEAGVGQAAVSDR